MSPFRFDLTPASTLYIDDNRANARAASEKGLVVCLFTRADRLARLLKDLGLIS